MTGKQLLEIIEKNYTVSAFGHDEMTETNEKVNITKEEETHGEELNKKRQDFFNTHLEELDYSERKKHPKNSEWEQMPNKWDYVRDLITSKIGLGKVIEVEQVGGEDEGSTWYSIKHFVDHDVYIRTDGYYQSYNGTDFHDGHGHVVTPQQRTITVFE